LNEEKGRKWRVHDSDRLPSCTLVALERHKSEQALNLETCRPEGTVYSRDPRAVTGLFLVCQRWNKEFRWKMTELESRQMH